MVMSCLHSCVCHAPCFLCSLEGDFLWQRFPVVYFERVEQPEDVVNVTHLVQINEVKSN